MFSEAEPGYVSTGELLLQCTDECTAGGSRADMAVVEEVAVET